MDREPFRAGDVVIVHDRQGAPYEEWLLAADERNGRVVCCGWPEATVEAELCTLLCRLAKEVV